MPPKPTFRRPLSPPKPPHTKNATRHESLLNALLCLSFNGLRLTRTKINSTLIYKQKPKLRKPKRIIVLIFRLRILANLV
ncbi:hypothetical protein D8T44_21740 [Vibrio vulnificus]|nr:hypothetical protein D8T44_21740 [Vibrio vulnificus]